MRYIATGLRFPEGPIALDDGSILLVEIERKTLSRVFGDGRVDVVAHFQGGPNGAALGPDGRVYICNNGGFSWDRNGTFLRALGQSDDYDTGRIETVDLATGKIERLYEECEGRALRGPNDLVFDAHGGFWFSDLGKRRERELDYGAIYWARADGSEIREVVHGMVSTNGIGLSPDGKTLYAAETITGRLWSWEITAPGEVRKRGWPALYGATLVAGPGGAIRFDSLAVTASGTICVAALEAAAILAIAPDEGQIRHHPVPDLIVTNICFGGKDMRTAFVTLSHQGALVALDWPEPGLRLNYRS